MSINVESLAVAHLNDLEDRPAEAFMDVPANRPAQFITVERTGGGHTDVRDIPLTALQCWAESRWEASELARVTAANIKTLVMHPAVGRVNVSGIYNFPAPSGESRYQIVTEIVTV